MGRPLGTKNGQGSGGNRATGSTSKDFAPSTNMQIRLGRVLESDLATIARFGFNCTLCEVDQFDAPFIDLTIEHFVPRSHFGSVKDHSACEHALSPNDASTIYSACRACNSAKKDLSFEQYGFIVAARTTQPMKTWLALESRVNAQRALLITREHSRVGNLVWDAWRELTAHIRALPQAEQTRVEFRKIKVWQVVERAIALSTLSERKAA